MCDISVAFEHEIARVHNSEKTYRRKAHKIMDISARYLRMLTQHKFLSAREASSISKIPYAGMVMTCFTNRIAGNQVESEIPTSEVPVFEFRMFSRALRHIILALMNIYEDWTVRKEIFREFILIVLMKTQLDQIDYEDIFGDYDIIDGYLLINNILDKEMRHSIKRELESRNLLEIFYYTHFDKSMWSRLIEK